MSTADELEFEKSRTFDRSSELEISADEQLTHTITKFLHESDVSDVDDGTVSEKSATVSNKSYQSTIKTNESNASNRIKTNSTEALNRLSEDSRESASSSVYSDQRHNKRHDVGKEESDCNDSDSTRRERSLSPKNSSYSDKNKSRKNSLEKNGSFPKSDGGKTGKHGNDSKKVFRSVDNGSSSKKPDGHGSRKKFNSVMKERSKVKHVSAEFCESDIESDDSTASTVKERFKVKHVSRKSFKSDLESDDSRASAVKKHSKVKNVSAKSSKSDLESDDSRASVVKKHSKVKHVSAKSSKNDVDSDDSSANVVKERAKVKRVSRKSFTSDVESDDSTASAFCARVMANTDDDSDKSSDSESSGVDTMKSKTKVVSDLKKSSSSMHNSSRERAKPHSSQQKSKNVDGNSRHHEKSRDSASKFCASVDSDAASSSDKKSVKNVSSCQPEVKSAKSHCKDVPRTGKHGHGDNLPKKNEKAGQSSESPKSSRGLTFFSNSMNAITSSSPFPWFTSASKPRMQRSESPVFAKVKLGGIRVFIDCELQNDPKLWQESEVKLVKCSRSQIDRLCGRKKELKKKDNAAAVKSASKHSSEFNKNPFKGLDESALSSDERLADKKQSNSKGSDQSNLHKFHESFNGSIRLGTAEKFTSKTDAALKDRTEKTKKLDSAVRNQTEKTKKLDSTGRDRSEKTEKDSMVRDQIEKTKKLESKARDHPDKAKKSDSTLKGHSEKKLDISMKDQSEKTDILDSSVRLHSEKTERSDSKVRDHSEETKKLHSTARDLDEKAKKHDSTARDGTEKVKKLHSTKRDKGEKEKKHHSTERVQTEKAKKLLSTTRDQDDKTKKPNQMTKDQSDRAKKLEVTMKDEGKKAGKLKEVKQKLEDYKKPSRVNEQSDSQKSGLHFDECLDGKNYKEDSRSRDSSVDRSLRADDSDDDSMVHHRNKSLDEKKSGTGSQHDVGRISSKNSELGRDSKVPSVKSESNSKTKSKHKISSLDAKKSQVVGNSSQPEKRKDVKNESSVFAGEKPQTDGKVIEKIWKSDSLSVSLVKNHSNKSSKNDKVGTVDNEAKKSKPVRKCQVIFSDSENSNSVLELKDGAKAEESSDKTIEFKQKSDDFLDDAAMETQDSQDAVVQDSKIDKKLKDQEMNKTGIDRSDSCSQIEATCVDDLKSNDGIVSDESMKSDVELSDKALTSDRCASPDSVSMVTSTENLELSGLDSGKTFDSVMQERSEDKDVPTKSSEAIDAGSDVESAGTSKREPEYGCESTGDSRAAGSDKEDVDQECHMPAPDEEDCLDSAVDAQKMPEQSTAVMQETPDRSSVEGDEVSDSEARESKADDISNEAIPTAAPDPSPPSEDIIDDEFEILIGSEDELSDEQKGSASTEKELPSSSRDVHQELTASSVPTLPSETAVTFDKGAVTAKHLKTEYPTTDISALVSVNLRSSEYEQLKKDRRLKPFVRLKTLPEELVKRLLADWENWKKHSATEAATSSVDRNRQLPTTNSQPTTSGKSQSQFTSTEKKSSVSSDLTKEKKKRNISSVEDSGSDEPSAGRFKPDGELKVDPSSDVRAEQKKRDESSLSDPISKSLMKVKAEFKRKSSSTNEAADSAKRQKLDNEKVTSSKENSFVLGKDKKKTSHLSFVIPKVKPEEKVGKTKHKKSKLPETQKWMPPPAPPVPIPRISKPPAPPKTLTEEDIGRSVLAKIDGTIGERDSLQWQTRDDWRGRTTLKSTEWVPLGPPDQSDDPWKRRGDQGNQRWRNWNGRGPDGGMNGGRGSGRFQNWNARPPEPGRGPWNRNQPNFKSANAQCQPPMSSGWQEKREQQPQQQPPQQTANATVESSSEWVRMTYNRDPLGLENKSAGDDIRGSYSPPGVVDDDDGYEPVANKQETQSTALPELDVDNLIKVLADAIQEVLISGTISEERRKKLHEIYTNLQKDLSPPGALIPAVNSAESIVSAFRNILQQDANPLQFGSALLLNPLLMMNERKANSDCDKAVNAEDFARVVGRQSSLAYNDSDERTLETRNVVSGESNESSRVSMSLRISSPKFENAASTRTFVSDSVRRVNSSFGFDNNLNVNPTASFMDTDDPNKMFGDIDERKFWCRKPDVWAGETTAANRCSPNRSTFELSKASLQTDSLCKPDDAVRKSDPMRQTVDRDVASDNVSSRENITISEKQFQQNSSSDPASVASEAKINAQDAKKLAEQKAIVDQIEGEVQLLDVLVMIQCELAEVKMNEETDSGAQEADGKCLSKPPEPAPTAEPAPDASCNSAVSSSSACKTATNSVADEESQDSSCVSNGQKSPDPDKSKQKTVNQKVLEDKVINLARNALKPFYHKSVITSEEFKLIMRKAISKIQVRSEEEIKETKITHLIKSYVERIVSSRKKLTL